MKPLYIFDLDGTLADQTHRQHLIPNWRPYFAACHGDGPIAPVLRTMRLLREAGSECWIWTGRSAEVLIETRKWLARFDAVPHQLRMRPESDHRSDDALKGEWLAQIERYDRDRLVGVFEDRDRVVKMWRDNAVQCFQVAPGAF